MREKFAPPGIRDTPPPWGMAYVTTAKLVSDVAAAKNFDGLVKFYDESLPRFRDTPIYDGLEAAVNNALLRMAAEESFKQKFSSAIWFAAVPRQWMLWFQGDWYDPKEPNHTVRGPRGDFLPPLDAVDVNPVRVQHSPTGGFVPTPSPTSTPPTDVLGQILTNTLPKPTEGSLPDILTVHYDESHRWDPYVGDQTIVGLAAGALKDKTEETAGDITNTLENLVPWWVYVVGGVLVVGYVRNALGPR